jgi:DNA polymerase-3 subunit beta
MKVQLPRQEFQEALAAIATLTGGRTTKPIFGCVKLATTDERLQLCGTDGEATLRVSVVTINAEQPGEAVVPADRLLSIVRELGDIEISLETDSRQCVIRGQGSEFKIYVMNPADFPPSPDFEGEGDLAVDGNELRRMIGLTSYAAARETSRYAINGVLWDKVGKKIFLVATDGRRLARAGGTLQQAKGSDFQLIVPAKALSVFERVFQPPKGGDGWVIEIGVMPNQLLLKSGERLLATTLVEGSFPDYEKVIPSDNDKRAKIPREEFYSAVRRAALMTTEDSRAVRFKFDAENLVISANAPEQGEARVEMPVEYEGEALEIGFNPSFVADALRAINYDDIFVELHETFRPGLLCGEDKSEFLYVVMPVSLST